MSVLQNVLFGLVVTLAHFVEGITGFGCTALALPFASMIAGVKTAVPVLVVIAWIQAVYIAVIDRKAIVWKEYLKIAGFVAIGFPIGIWAYGMLPEALLKKCLAVFMVIVSLRGIYTAFHPKRETCNAKEIVPATHPQAFLYKALLFMGGIVHGAFGAGGPFIIIYAVKALPDKRSFRATLCLLWASLNTILITKNIYYKSMTGDVVRLLLFVIPFLIAGILLGNIAHKKIRENVFSKVIYVVLFASAIAMFL